MGAKLTRLQDSVNNTRQRVSSSLAKRTANSGCSSSAANGAAAAELDGDCSDRERESLGVGDGGGKDDDGCNVDSEGCKSRTQDANNHGVVVLFLYCPLR
ncbi:hypothetical protein ElyMa_003589700 [Elysia marginata]|uniref:Uncharacterized protein n=1 Tax=Elysia marginata TaxID=1093978 RepID=A0AAV4EQ11_9GAST|nr:hypothetical protein ElyMa_003589700 [Elysia marginata]